MASGSRVGMVYINRGGFDASLSFHYMVGGAKDRVQSVMRELVVVNRETTIVMAVTTMFLLFVRLVAGV